MYFDGELHIELDIRRIEIIMNHIKGHALIISAYTNARNKMWYDVINNERGKILQEFITISDLHILNKKTEMPTFESARGRRWVDLTITNNQLLRQVLEWNTEKESCFDHKIISFKIGEVNHSKHSNIKGIRYLTKGGDY